MMMHAIAQSTSFHLAPHFNSLVLQVQRLEIITTHLCVPNGYLKEEINKSSRKCCNSHSSCSSCLGETKTTSVIRYFLFLFFFPFVPKRIKLNNSKALLFFSTENRICSDASNEQVQRSPEILEG